MSSLFSGVSKAVGSALHWWRQNLVSALPSSLRGHFNYVEEPLTLRYSRASSAGISATDHQNGRLVKWVLDDDLVLSHEFNVPKVALSEVKNIVRLELERIMPLPTDQLLHAYNLKRLPASNGALVTLFAFRKSIADQIFVAAERNGDTVHAIEVADEFSQEPISFDLKTIKNRSLIRLSCIAALVVTLFAIATLFPSQYHSRIEASINEIDLNVSETRRETEKIASLQRQMQSMQSLYSEVQAEQRSVSPLKLLDMTTQASPDDVVFEEVRLDGQRVYVTGVAVAPENWVIDLERNASFSNVTLSSVVGLDEGLSKRFEVRFDVLPEKERLGAS